MRDWGRLAAIVSAAVLVTGCEEVWNSVYREGKLGVVTDAKQRVIISVDADNNVDKRPGHNEPKKIVCAEPSPDVAQAISTALQASLSVEAKGANVGAGFGFSSSAAVAQLGERLATIQLLRDKMYRACEAYANGAVNASGYTLMLARLDKTMVTLLTNEMAAGAFGRALAQIGGNAATSTVDPVELADARKKVDDQHKALEAAAKETNPNREKIETERKALETATNNLINLAARSIRASATAAAAGTIGQIAGHQPTAGTGSGATLAAIHRAYMDDNGLDAIMDACITAVDHGAIPFFRDEHLNTLRLLEEGVRDREQLSYWIKHLKQNKDAPLNEEHRKKIREMLIRIAGGYDGEGGKKKLFEDEAKNELVQNTKGKARLLRNTAAAADLEAELRSNAKAFEEIEDRRPVFGRLRLEFAESAGYGFASFCLTNILPGNSPYMERRLKQELDLRNASISIRKEELATCNKMLDNPKISDAERAATYKTCNGVLSR